LVFPKKAKWIKSRAKRNDINVPIERIANLLGAPVGFLKAWLHYCRSETEWNEPRPVTAVD